MRLRVVVVVVSAFATTSVQAFLPCSSTSFGRRGREFLMSAVEEAAPPAAVETVGATASASASEIKSKSEAQLAKMKTRDASSKVLSKEDLKIIYEDEHIIVVDKPTGVLTVPGKENNPSLSQTIFDSYGCESNRADKMVVHRLGMDTSGLVVFARTDLALRGMNTLFRTRKITRKYEALLCGSVEDEEGVINLPLMRCYECPPYMRISTDEHQRALIGLDVQEVGKKLLESPKDSLTKYEVVGREDLGGNPVSRVQLTSISGRTHQLNVHCAAFGHPIVGDKIYGLNGEAAPNGGLDQGTSSSSASKALQEQIAAAAGDQPMCVHAKTISFEHPVTNEKLSFSSDAPF